MVHLSRRAMLAAPAVLSAVTASAACAQASRVQNGSATLVAYFTRSGNTRVIAETIHRQLKTDLFEICPAQPYPADYLQTVGQAAQETGRGFEPPLEAKVSDLNKYATVFLGFPIWGQTAPPIIRSFLRAHDLKGKTLRPLITHGGFGLGNSLSVLASHAPGARIESAFSMEADQERRTLNTITGWLSEEGLQ
jgi:flavodoxin